MSRPLRLEFPGALYHLTARGDRREPIFDDDEDRQELLDLLVHGLDRFDADCFAFCLMGNHYHVVVQTHAGNLSRLMRHLNGVYTQRYNRRHGKVGHLFQGRFKAVLVDADAYFLAVCRYVDLNPVRAGLVRHPKAWAWSSYRAHAGLAAPLPWLRTAELHRRLSPQAPERGAAAYAQFVAEGRGVRLWDDALSGQIYLGSAAFAELVPGLASCPAAAASVKARTRRPSTPRQPKCADVGGEHGKLVLDGGGGDERVAHLQPVAQGERLTQVDGTLRDGFGHWQ